jgi:outer membrane protein assembly factor BamB
LIVLILAGSLFALPWIWITLDPEVELTVMIPLFMPLQYLMPMTAALLITVWWLLFSGLRWFTRLGVGVLVALAATGFYYSIRKAELTNGRVGLVPRFDFIWEPSFDDHLARYLKEDSSKADSLSGVSAAVGPEDFASYRGVNSDGAVPYLKLETDWKTHPPKVLWQHPCGDGYSGIAIAKDIAVTIEQRGDKETIVCYDRASGRQVWDYSYDVFYKDVMGSGPRSTPTIHDKHIYTTGATGELVCLNAQGKKQWSINILEDNQAKNVKWGLTGSPLIVEDLVVVNAGIDPDKPAGAALASYEQKTGKKRWAVGNRKAGYSSPQLATLAGKQQILLFDGEALAGYDPKNGQELWQTPWATKWETNSIQPVIVGDDRIFISSESDNGGALLRVKPPDNDGRKWTVEPVWTNKILCSRYANPVTDGKYIYGLNKIEGVLTCVDVATGKRQWQGERCGAGQLLLADGVLIVVNSEGVVMLIAADPGEFKELARFPVFNDKTWNTPALAGDQLFLRNQRLIACVKLPRRASGEAPR